MKKIPAKCPKCNTPFPKFPGVLLPTNLDQAIWGGWTCPKCGAEIDNKGKLRKLKDKN